MVIFEEGHKESMKRFPVAVIARGNHQVWGAQFKQVLLRKHKTQNHWATHPDIFLEY